MSGASKIEWTDATWNPVRGCRKISPGCKHCYAETFAERFRGVKSHAYEQGFDPRMAPDQLDAPLHWRKPRRVFVNSMSDLFLMDWSNEYIAAVFGVMTVAKQHEFQALTKRSERMCAWFEWVVRAARDANAGRGMSIPAFCIAQAQRHSDHPLLRRNLDEVFRYAWPLRNTWLGVSVEDRKHGVPRINDLRTTQAAVRFLSIEPLLEDLGALDLTGIHWVIVGGESGHGARPMQEDWVRSIRDQCHAAGVRFLYKQRIDRGRKVSLPVLDGRQWAEFPGEVRS